MHRVAATKITCVKGPLRLSVHVKIRHFGLNKRAKRTAFQKRKVLGENIIIIHNTALRSSVELYAELAGLTSFLNKPRQQNMASCQYGRIAGGICGSSVDNPANVKSVVLAKCTKAIQGDLPPYNVRSRCYFSLGVKAVTGKGKYVCCTYTKYM